MGWSGPAYRLSPVGALVEGARSLWPLRMTADAVCGPVARRHFEPDPLLGPLHGCASGRASAERYRGAVVAGGEASSRHRGRVTVDPPGGTWIRRRDRGATQDHPYASRLAASTESGLPGPPSADAAPNGGIAPGRDAPDRAGLGLDPARVRRRRGCSPGHERRRARGAGPREPLSRCSRDALPSLHRGWGGFPSPRARQRRPAVRDTDPPKGPEATPDPRGQQSPVR